MAKYKVLQELSYEPDGDDAPTNIVFESGDSFTYPDRARFKKKIDVEHLINKGVIERIEADGGN